MSDNSATSNFINFFEFEFILHWSVEQYKYVPRNYRQMALMDSSVYIKITSTQIIWIIVISISLMPSPLSWKIIRSKPSHPTGKSSYALK